MLGTRISGTRLHRDFNGLLEYRLERKRFALDRRASWCRRLQGPRLPVLPLAVSLAVSAALSGYTDWLFLGVGDRDRAIPVRRTVDLARASLQALGPSTTRAVDR